MQVLFVIPLCDQENLGVLNLVGFLKKAGYDAGISLLSYNQISKQLFKSKDTILAYYTTTIHYRYVLNLNRKLKSQFPRILSLFGGPHPTFFPEMIEEEGVDGVCIGEGEYAMLDMVKNLTEGKPITDIRNWWIKEDGKVYKNPLRPLIEDLDSLPFPDRSYSKNILSLKIGRVSVITSRGCPYKCSYCFNHAYNRLYNNPSGRVRRRSVDNVVEEIRQLKAKFPLKMIIFQDDTFILDRQWLEEFSHKYKREVDLPFCCFVRANLMDQEIVCFLKKAGCVIMNMGIECADAYFRNEILKRDMSRELIVRAARLIKNEGVCLRTTNILGIPGASLDIDFETIKLNIECKPDFARANVLSAYPKTDIYSVANEYNLLDLSFKSTTACGNWSLKRRYKNKRQKRRLENLSCLFPLNVRFPFLLPFTKILVELSLTRLFSICALLCLIYQLYFYKIPKINEGPFIKRIINQRKIFKDIIKLYATRYNVD